MQLTLDLSLIVAICTTVYLMGFSLGTTSSQNLESWNIYGCLFVFTGVLIYRICRWKQLCHVEKNVERELSWESLDEQALEKDKGGEYEEEPEANALGQQVEEGSSLLEEVFQRVLRVAEGWLEDDMKQKLQDCLEEGFLDFALSENNRFSSDWSLHKVNLQVGDQKPLIRGYEFEEKLLERNRSSERVLSLQGTISVYFKSFMKLTLIRKVAVVNNRIVLSSPATGEQETCSILLQVTVKDVSVDTRVEAELLPEYPFLGSISFCILEPVNFNVDFHISTDNEVSYLTTSSAGDSVDSDGIVFDESNFNQLLFHFIDEGVFRHIAYPNVRTVNFPSTNIVQPNTELTINTTDMSNPSFKEQTSKEGNVLENDKLVEFHLIEGFLSFKEPSDEAAKFSTGKLGLYVNLKNSNEALIFTSSTAYCNMNLEWKHVWKIPWIHFQNGYILLEVFLGNMQHDDIFLGRLRLLCDRNLEESEKWYSVKEDLRPNVDVLKLRIFMRLLTSSENEESVELSSNISPPEVSPTEASEQHSKLRRFSSTGSASQDGTESMLKRLGKKLLFQHYSVEVTTHEWSLEDILFHMRIMMQEKGISKKSDSEVNRIIDFSSLSVTSKRFDEISTFYGSDAVEWLLRNAKNKISNRNEAVEILKTCTDLGIILAVDGHLRRHHGFLDSSTSKYSFSPYFRNSVERCDGRSHSCVLNQGQILVFSTNSLLTGSIEFPVIKSSQLVLGLGEKLVLHIAELLKKQSLGLNDFVFIPKLEPKYFRFLRTCRKLQYISYDVLCSMSSVERSCFFINVYNALFLHSLMLSGSLRRFSESEDVFDFYSEGGKLFREAICYRIGANKDKETLPSLVFSLNDILNGILRCNRMPSGCCQDWVDCRTSVDSAGKRPPSEESPSCNVCFPLSDARAQLSIKMSDFDPRIHFLLLNYPSFQPRVLYLCRPSNLELLLNEATSSFCAENVDVDEGKKVVSLPFLIRNYIEDFLPPEVYGDATEGMDINAAYELLRVAAEFLPNDSEKKAALSRLLVSCLDSDKNDSDQSLADCVHLFFKNPTIRDQQSVPFVTFSKELTRELEISK